MWLFAAARSNSPQPPSFLGKHRESAQQVEMLCELWKSAKSFQRAKFLPIVLLNPVPSFVPKFRMIMVLAAWVLAICAPIAQAQSSEFVAADGKISGTVLSQGDNRTLSQVAVDLRSHSAGVFRSVLTDFDGHFEVLGLPAGTYEIVVEESGYESVRTKAQLVGRSLKLVLYLLSSKPSQARRNNYTVSVRDLKIPGKARNEFRKGLECMAKKDPAGSLSHFTKATQAFPDYYEAYYHAGLMETKLGHRDEAMQDFQRAIDLSGGRYAWADFGMGYLLYQEGKPGEAEAIVRRGLEVDGDSPDGYALLGMALLRLNRVEEAENSARAALLRKPDFAEAYLVLADVYARRRNFREQLQDLDAYLQLDPTGPASTRVHQAREVALRMLGEAQPQH